VTGPDAMTSSGGMAGSAAHIPCRAAPDLPHRQRLSDRDDRRGEEDENAAERRRDSAHAPGPTHRRRLARSRHSREVTDGVADASGAERLDITRRIPERRAACKSLRPRLAGWVEGSTVWQKLL